MNSKSEVEELREQVKRLRELLVLREQSHSQSNQVTKADHETPGACYIQERTDLTDDESSYDSDSGSSRRMLLSDAQAGIRLMNFVGEFNGYNRPVDRFLDEVRTLLDNFDVDETIIITLAINMKLKGDARELLDCYSVHCYAELEEVLTNEYGQTKSYGLVSFERQLFRQGKLHVREYTRMFNLIHRDVIRSLGSRGLNDTEKLVAIKLENQTALVTYIRNLNEPTQTNVRCQRPQSLKEAQQIAYELVREAELKQLLENSYIRTAHEELQPCKPITTQRIEPMQRDKQEHAPIGTVSTPSCYRYEQTGHYTSDGMVRIQQEDVTRENPLREDKKECSQITLPTDSLRFTKLPSYSIAADNEPPMDERQPHYPPAPQEEMQIKTAQTTAFYSEFNGSLEHMHAEDIYSYNTVGHGTPDYSTYETAFKRGLPAQRSADILSRRKADWPEDRAWIKITRKKPIIFDPP